RGIVRAMDGSKGGGLSVSVVATLDGVATAIVVFLLACLVFPKLVKNRPQYYASPVLVIGLILLHTLGVMIHSVGFIVFAGAISGFLQVIAIVMLVMCVGGLTVGELAGDLSRAYEVIRRGETQKEVIIPLGGQVPGERNHPEPVPE